jgi:ATP-dependent DNA helicase RecG
VRLLEIGVVSRRAGNTPAAPAAEIAAPSLEAALDALRRPLDFAARDDFAHQARVRNLQESVRSACQSLRNFSIPSDFQSYFKDLEEQFSKPLEAAEQRACIREGLEALRAFEQPGWQDAILARPTEVLAGVGPKRARSLAQRGLRSVGDLIFHLPSGYEDRRSLTRIDELEVGRRATFIGELLLVDFMGSRSGGRFRRILQAVVGDDRASINLKWFRGAESIAKSLHKGARVLVTGDVKRYRFSKEIVHPEIELLDEPAVAQERPGKSAKVAQATKGAEPASSAVPDSALRRVVPRYTAPEGVNPRTLRRLIERAVDEYADLVAGHLPPARVRELGLPDPPAAIRALHRPPSDADVDAYAARVSPAHRRLVLEELYLLEVGLVLRQASRARLPGVPFDVAQPRVARCAEALPFTLTGAQTRTWNEIRADLARPHPMNRLLHGDVGCGKTAVALLAAVAAAASGQQAALMAPTELLAEQHARTLARLAQAGGDVLGLRIGRLSASLPTAEAARIRAELESGALDLVVGTHALVQEDVRFARLGLAIVDEQHRFGVRQRAALASRRDDGRDPHVLVMTATPIPRTLALTVYGDLDVSVIDELPPGRTAVDTRLLRDGEGARISAVVRETLARGERVYVVYPLVEESEKIDLRSALESTERIRAAFPEAEVDIVHGRLDAADRARVMDRFAAGEVQVLVSTTVIEVGVDVPEATLMVVEHAERFGLAQLHQLRGRVGRGKRPGTCLLVARGGGEQSEARLRALLETTDGFEIAEADLCIRGPGEFLGTRQSGQLPDLRIADLVRDARLVSLAREAALETVRADATLREHPALARAVALRWGDRLALADVG